MAKVLVLIKGVDFVVQLFMSKRYWVIFIILIIALIASVSLVLKTTIFGSKAATVSSSVVLENSYLFASPIQAKADGQEKVRITVFLLDGRGLGVPNQTVILNTPSQVTVKESQNITDTSGKAIFDLSSSIIKTFNISAQVGNKVLPQQVKVVFY